MIGRLSCQCTAPDPETWTPRRINHEIDNNAAIGVDRIVRLEGSTRVP